MMGTVYECDQCGKTSGDLKGWYVVTHGEGPKPRKRRRLLIGHDLQRSLRNGGGAGGRR